MNPPRVSAFALRAGLGAAGIAVGVAGMAMDRRWLVWMAVVLLTAAVVARLVERRGRRRAEP